MAKHSTLKGEKPSKPNADFPLFAHASGRWAKKIRQKMHYFGPWRDPDGALAKWLKEKDYLLNGLAVPDDADPDALTVMELCNDFLKTKKHLVSTKDLSTVSFADYHATCQRVIDKFGKDRTVVSLTPTDFLALRAAIAKTRGPVSLGNEVNRVRILFKFAFTETLIDKPVNFGTAFVRPKEKVLRKERRKRGKRIFAADDIRKLVETAGTQMKAMIYLAINAGLGNTDIGCIPMGAIDLKSGWLDFPRPKTSVDRRCPLWPETVAAVKAAIEQRPEPKGVTPPDLLFVTKQGKAWVRHATKTTEEGDYKACWMDSVHLQFSKLLTTLKIKRPGLSFYALRHLFETVGGESRDQVAVDFLMGHVDESMAGRNAIDFACGAFTPAFKLWLLDNGASKRLAVEVCEDLKDLACGENRKSDGRPRLARLRRNCAALKRLIDGDNIGQDCVIRMPFTDDHRRDAVETKIQFSIEGMSTATTTHEISVANRETAVQSAGDLESRDQVDESWPVAVGWDFTRPGYAAFNGAAVEMTATPRKVLELLARFSLRGKYVRYDDLSTHIWSGMRDDPNARKEISKVRTSLREIRRQLALEHLKMPANHDTAANRWKLPHDMIGSVIPPVKKNSQPNSQ